MDLAHQAKFQASFRKVAGLPFDVPVNWPPPAEDKEIFTDGRGSYKVYCKIAGFIILSFPTEPKISFSSQRDTPTVAAAQSVTEFVATVT